MSSSATFSPTLSSAQPDATSSPGGSSGNGNVDGSGGGGGSGSSSLYLYTFLVTLALLLSISAAIVTRSYIIRRRLRALIAAGLLPPGALGGRGLAGGGAGGAALGRKPALFEVYTADADEKAGPLSAARVGAMEKERDAGAGAGGAAGRPRPVQRPSFAVPFFSRSDPYAEQPQPRPALPARSSSGWGRLNPFARASREAADPEQAAPAAPAPSGEEGAGGAKGAEDVQLALFVRMPAPAVHAHEAEEGVPRAIEIGVRTVRA